MSEIENQKNIYMIKNGDLVVNWNLNYRDAFKMFKGNKKDFPSPNFDFEEISKIEDYYKIKNIYICHPMNIKFIMSKQNQFPNVESIFCYTSCYVDINCGVTISCEEIISFVANQCPNINDIYLTRCNKSDGRLSEMIQSLEHLNRPVVFFIDRKAFCKEDFSYKDENIERKINRECLMIDYKTINNSENKNLEIYIDKDIDENDDDDVIENLRNLNLF